MTSLMAPILGVAVPLLGGLVLLIVLAALLAWYRVTRMRGEPPPELTDDGESPPADRDDTWDPRERYDG